MTRTARVAGGVLAGVLAGLGLTLGGLVANARLRGEYLESAGDAIGVQLVLGVLAPLVGGWLAYRGGETARLTALGTLAGAVSGTIAGSALGSLLDPHASGAWAGGVIGVGMGILLGGVCGAVWARSRARLAPGTTTDRGGQTLRGPPVS